MVGSQAPSQIPQLPRLECQLVSSETHPVYSTPKGLQGQQRTPMRCCSRPLVLTRQAATPPAAIIGAFWCPKELVAAAATSGALRLQPPRIVAAKQHSVHELLHLSVCSNEQRHADIGYACPCSRGGKAVTELLCLGQHASLYILFYTLATHATLPLLKAFCLSLSGREVECAIVDFV